MSLTAWATGYVSGVATVVLCLLSGAAWQLCAAERRRADVSDDPYRWLADAPPDDFAPLDVREGA